MMKLYLLLFLFFSSLSFASVNKMDHINEWEFDKLSNFISYNGGDINDVDFYVQGENVNITIRDSLSELNDGIELLTSKVSIGRKSRYFYSLKNSVVVNSDGNIVLLNININKPVSDDFFSQFKYLTYLSVSVSGVAVKLNLESNFFLDEIYINEGDISQLVLPKSGTIKLIGTLSGSVFKFVNLSHQKNLNALMVNYDAKNISDINGNDTVSFLRLLGYGKVNLNPSTLKNLQYFNVIGDENFDVSLLENLEKIKIIYLGDYIVVEGESFAPSLEVLRFGGVVNKRMPNLSNQKNLKELFVIGTGIESISGLDHSINLEKLVFIDNPINNIQGVDKLIDLRKLEIKGSNIQNIENIQNLNSLEYLYLPYNKIRVVKDLNLPPSLKSLRLYGNDIERIDLLQLKDLPDRSVMIDTDPEFENNMPSLRRKIL
ncbi:possible surface protein [Photobacterium aphoticum]|uniref:Possible surface protein n=1 Tax=Photobacterium aphoticum TaxID=754436 RepID=A0A090RDH5_9GAMM|nr:possible surface protein [Photobacterium aphoticum]